MPGWRLAAYERREAFARAWSTIREPQRITHALSDRACPERQYLQVPGRGARFQEWAPEGARQKNCARRGPVYAAVGTTAETVFPLEGGDADPPHHHGPPGGGGLQRRGWASASYDSLPSSAALDDGLDPQRSASLERCALLAHIGYPHNSQKVPNHSQLPLMVVEYYGGRTGVVC